MSNFFPGKFFGFWSPASGQFFKIAQNYTNYHELVVGPQITQIGTDF